MRERAINIKQKLGIVNTVDMTEEEKEEAGLIEIIKEEKPKKPAIPIPPIYEVADYATQVYVPWRPPEHYIKFFTNIGADILTEFDYYELQKEDIEWLNAFTEAQAKSRAAGRVPDKRDMEKSIELFERESFEIAKGMDPTADFPIIMATQLCQDQLGLKGKFVESLYEYWKAKRKRLKKSLMRQYQLPPSLAGPHHAFVPRTMGRRSSTRNPRKNEPSSYCKMRYLKKDFEDVLDVLQLMRKREIYKRHGCLIEIEDFDHQLSQSKWFQRFKTEREKLSDLLAAETKAKKEQKERGLTPVYNSTETRPNSALSIAGAASGPGDCDEETTIEEWWDVAPPEFDENLSVDQLIIRLLGSKLPLSSYKVESDKPKARVPPPRKPIKMRKKFPVKRDTPKTEGGVAGEEDEEELSEVEDKKYESEYSDDSEEKEYFDETSGDEEFYNNVNLYIWKHRDGRPREIPSGGMGLSGSYLIPHHHYNSISMEVDSTQTINAAIKIEVVAPEVDPIYTSSFGPPPGSLSSSSTSISPTSSLAEEMGGSDNITTESPSPLPSYTSSFGLGPPLFTLAPSISDSHNSNTHMMDDVEPSSHSSTVTTTNSTTLRGPVNPINSVTTAAPTPTITYHPTTSFYHRWQDPTIIEEEWSSGAEEEDDEKNKLLPLSALRSGTYLSDSDERGDREYSRKSLTVLRSRLHKRQRELAYMTGRTISGIDSDESSSDEKIGAVAVAREGRGGRIWIEVLENPSKRLRKLFMADKEQRLEEAAAVVDIVPPTTLVMDAGDGGDNSFLADGSGGNTANTNKSSKGSSATASSQDNTGRDTNKDGKDSNGFGGESDLVMSEW